jgi:hypothetical protein
VTARARIQDAKQRLVDLADELESDRDLDRARLQLLASCIDIALDGLEDELTLAVHDIEAALRKIWGSLT